MLYGIWETVNGNWSQLDMTSELGASITEAALALTAGRGHHRLLPARLRRRRLRVGPLIDAGVTLPAVYAAAAGIAVAMGLLSFRVTRPAHPR